MGVGLCVCVCIGLCVYDVYLLHVCVCTQLPLPNPSCCSPRGFYFNLLFFAILLLWLGQAVAVKDGGAAGVMAAPAGVAAQGAGRAVPTLSICARTLTREPS